MESKPAVGAVVPIRFRCTPPYLVEPLAVGTHGSHGGHLFRCCLANEETTRPLLYRMVPMGTTPPAIDQDPRLNTPVINLADATRLPLMDDPRVRRGAAERPAEEEKRRAVRCPSGAGDVGLVAAHLDDETPAAIRSRNLVRDDQETLLIAGHITD